MISAIVIHTLTSLSNKYWKFILIFERLERQNRTQLYCTGAAQKNHAFKK